MSWSTNDATRAVANELLKISGAEHWRHSIVSWPMSEGCRFSVVLGAGNPPIGGVAMPMVASRAGEILKAIGVPQDMAKDRAPGWRMAPCLFLDFDGMTGRDRMDQTMRLRDGAAADPDIIRKIVDYALLAAEKTREHAATIDMALDYARKTMLTHPQYLWIIPVGYRLIGRTIDADEYVEEQLTRLRAGNNASVSKLYEVFAGELKRI